MQASSALRRLCYPATAMLIPDPGFQYQQSAPGNDANRARLLSHLSVMPLAGTLPTVNDKQARFTELYRTEYDAVYRFLSLRTTQPADTAHETFSTAWRCLDDIPADPTAARAWLFTAARNQLLRDQRSAMRADKLAVKVAAHSDETLAGPENTVVVSEQLNSAWRQLPAQHQELLALVGFEGLTLAQAAKVLGVSVPTARLRLKRARAVLRSLMEDGERDSAPARTAPPQTSAQQATFAHSRAPASPLDQQKRNRRSTFTATNPSRTLINQTAPLPQGAMS